LPNLDSAHEQESADFEAPIWFAVFRPRGASEPIIRKLNRLPLLPRYQTCAGSGGIYEYTL
jgi:hypothetical protein